MPFWKKNSGSRTRQLVEEEKYDEVAALASEDPGTAVQLARLLLDPDEEIREGAAFGLASIGKNDHEVPDTIKTVVPELIALLEHPKAKVRQAASSAVAGVAWNWLMWEDFGEIASQVLAPVSRLLNDADAKVRAKAAEATKVLAEWAADDGDTSRLEGAVPKLVAFLEDPSADLRSESVHALAAIARRRPDLVAASAPAIMTLLRDPNDFICLGACIALTYVGESHVESVRPGEAQLVALLEGPARWDGLANDYAAIVWAFIAAETRPLAERVAPRLIECLSDRPAVAREGAARALARIAEGYPELAVSAVPLLEEMIRSQDEGVRLAAAAALRCIHQ